MKGAEKKRIKIDEKSVKRSSLISSKIEGYKEPSSYIKRKARTIIKNLYK